MSIGLSSTDIDSLVNICEVKEGGNINWSDFIKKV